MLYINKMSLVVKCLAFELYTQIDKGNAGLRGRVYWRYREVGVGHREEWERDRGHDRIWSRNWNQMTISQKFSGTLWSRLRWVLRLVVVVPPGHSVQRKQPVACIPTDRRAVGSGLASGKGSGDEGWRERSGGGRKMRGRREISSSLLLLSSTSRYFWRLTIGLGQMFPRWNERTKWARLTIDAAYINRIQFRRISFCGCGQKCMYLCDVAHVGLIAKRLTLAAELGIRITVFSVKTTIRYQLIGMFNCCNLHISNRNSNCFSYNRIYEIYVNLCKSM